MAMNPAQHVRMAMWGPPQLLTHHFSTKTRCMGAQAQVNYLFSGTKSTLLSMRTVHFCEGGPTLKGHYICSQNCMLHGHNGLLLRNVMQCVSTKPHNNFSFCWIRLAQTQQSSPQKSCNNIACGCCGVDTNLTPTGLLLIHLKEYKNTKLGPLKPISVSSQLKIVTSGLHTI